MGTDFDVGLSTNPRTLKKSLTHYLSKRKWIAHKDFNVAHIARNHGPFLRRLNLMKKLPVHEGCVNTICWNKTGEYLLSGSDDCNLCITKPMYLYDTSKDYSVLHKVPTKHLGNIFSAQFIPYSGDTKIVSCSSNGPVILHDIYAADPSEGLLSFNCHSSVICEVVTVADNDNIFLSCSEDKTIRLFDMRVHSSCSRAGTCPHPPLIKNSHAITTLCLHPSNSNLMLAGRADGLGLVYDRRKLLNPAEFSREKAHEERLAGRDTLASSFKYRHPMEGVVAQFQVPDMDTRYQFTSLCYNHNGTQVLASYLGEYLYLFNHDTSSNIELVQTLPKKPPTVQPSDESSSNDDSITNTADRQQGHTTGSNSNNNISGSNQGTTRISRIRVRGDWSDTGVNSVPHSRRSEGTRQAEQASRLTQLGFIELTVIDDQVRARARRRHEESDDETAEEEDEEEEEQNKEDNNEMMDMDSERGQGSDETDPAAKATNDDQETANTTVDNMTSFSSEATRRRHRISSETRAKFKRTLDGLKDKYGQINTYRPCVKYQGHRNSRTSIKEAIFWGDDYIMSGSDCGRIMVWEKKTAKLLMAFQADKHVVNCLKPNPHHYVLASSGIDYDIKLWSTQSLVDEPLMISEERMKEIVENNEIMLEESKHTFSVPPHLFFRMLATLARS